MFVSGGTELSEIKELLSNFREVNDRVQVRYLSPDLDLEEIHELQRRYGFVGRQGILVVYGNDDKARTALSSRTTCHHDQWTAPSPTPRTSPVSSSGEDALMTEINYLAEGQKKPVVYFTQGNGELDLQSMDSSRLDQGCGLLRERLEQRRFEVKPLKFTPASHAFRMMPTSWLWLGHVVRCPILPCRPCATTCRPPIRTEKGKMMVLLGVSTARTAVCTDRHREHAGRVQGAGRETSAS